ncbi:PREDICTED: pancreatic triacylglycerol lipase-like [Cyphomyrmex costatus]|uniref:pancreatic triacylglycerol lipase-like n=1 Tax=Cyphomyrmex costatus TaxID=456900 RepID=UPI000852322C|nr:PREDICTED: pancreatic triacylglycerol lipase-like [Cyphomyrmex costatus]
MCILIELKITLNMGMYVLIGVLLACSVTGLPVKEEVLSDNIFTSLDYAFFENEEAYVYDDNKNLVKLTLEDDYVEQSAYGNDSDVSDRVLFYLYKKDNPIEPKQLYVDDKDTLKNSNFDPTQPTRFITHGWKSSRNSASCTLIRDAYLQVSDYNVIVIDWSAISSMSYVSATRRVMAIGQFVATMIDFLVKNGMNPWETKVIGHSLGAHVAGIAAYNATSDVDYVVGLDPALPGFRVEGPGLRISNEDANYVEIIHTNGGVLGFLEPIGNIDFYPNGGQKQVGCGVDLGGSCSHSRSFQYFAESITSHVGFLARQCDSFSKFKSGLCNDTQASFMGGHKPFFRPNGKFYLITNPSSPFAIEPLAM